MIKSSDKEIKKMIRKSLMQYEGEIIGIAEDEHKSLHEWAASSGCPYDNPFCLYTEADHPMDYITAIRIYADMVNSPQDYVTAFEPEGGAIL